MGDDSGAGFASGRRWQNDPEGENLSNGLQTPAVRDPGIARPISATLRGDGAEGGRRTLGQVCEDLLYPIMVTPHFYYVALFCLWLNF
jgi:hypothetical protein